LSGGNSNRRSKLEQRADVLELIATIHSPTKLMNAANLSWAPLTKEIIPALVKNDLISETLADNCSSKNRYTYYLTPRGVETLKMWGEIQRRLGVDLANNKIFFIRRHQNDLQKVFTT